MYKGELDFVSETISELEYRMHILRLMRESVCDDAKETYDSVVSGLEIIVPALNCVYKKESEVLKE